MRRSRGMDLESGRPGAFSFEVVDDRPVAPVFVAVGRVDDLQVVAVDLCDEDVIGCTAGDDMHRSGGDGMTKPVRGPAVGRSDEHALAGPDDPDDLRSPQAAIPAPGHD